MEYDHDAVPGRCTGPHDPLLGRTLQNGQFDIHPRHVLSVSRQLPYFPDQGPCLQNVREAETDPEPNRPTQGNQARVW